jgi:hypothetical protein
MLRLLIPAVVGGVVAVGAAGAASLASLAQDSAAVGDIIAFVPVANAEPDPDPRIAVHRPDQFGCVLDINTLRQIGGSLVIEAKMAAEGRTFRLHWAGERTTGDSADCGRSADLIVDNRDLNALAMAAGGFGLGRSKARPVYTIGTGQ